jgi:hypothetical protein
MVQATEKQDQPMSYQLEIKVPLDEGLKQAYDFKKATELCCSLVTEFKMDRQFHIISFDYDCLQHVREIEMEF